MATSESNVFVHVYSFRSRAAPFTTHCLSLERLKATVADKRASINDQMREQKKEKMSHWKSALTRLHSIASKEPSLKSHTRSARPFAKTWTHHVNKNGSRVPNYKAPTLMLHVHASPFIYAKGA